MLSPPAGADDPGLVNKSSFADLCHVSPARVSQWIADKKLFGEALVGEGRHARVRVTVACAQLKRTLDLSQRLGDNGISTKLDGVADLLPQPALPPNSPFSSPDTIEDQFKREKLESVTRANRRAAREEAESIGRLTDSSLAQQQMGRVAAQLITVFEGAIPEIAAACAAAFNISHRDVVHVLRGEFRKTRANAARALQRNFENVPSLISIELGDEDGHEAAVAPLGPLADQAAPGESVANADSDPDCQSRAVGS